MILSVWEKKLNDGTQHWKDIEKILGKKLWYNNYVVDFIYFSLINFPVFNVADCYVTVSVILLLILIMWYYTDEDLDDIKKGLKITKNG